MVIVLFSLTIFLKKEIEIVKKEKKKGKKKEDRPAEGKRRDRKFHPGGIATDGASEPASGQTYFRTIGQM